MNFNQKRERNEDGDHTCKKYMDRGEYTINRIRDLPLGEDIFRKISDYVEDLETREYHDVCYEELQSRFHPTRVWGAFHIDKAYVIQCPYCNSGTDARCYEKDPHIYSHDGFRVYHWSQGCNTEECDLHHYYERDFWNQSGRNDVEMRYHKIPLDRLIRTSEYLSFLDQ